jgi:hypothetical protein
MDVDSDAEELFPAAPAAGKSHTKSGSRFKFADDDFTSIFTEVFDELAEYLADWYVTGSLTPDELKCLHPSNGPFRLVASSTCVRVENNSGDVVAVVPKELVDKVEPDPPPLSSESAEESVPEEVSPGSYGFNETDKLTLSFASTFGDLADLLYVKYKKDKSLSRKERSELHPIAGLFSVVRRRGGQFWILNSRDVEVASVPKSILRIGRISTIRMDLDPPLLNPVPPSLLGLVLMREVDNQPYQRIRGLAHAPASLLTTTQGQPLVGANNRRTLTLLWRRKLMLPPLLMQTWTWIDTTRTAT